MSLKDVPVRARLRAPKKADQFWSAFFGAQRCPTPCAPFQGDFFRTSCGGQKPLCRFAPVRPPSCIFCAHRQRAAFVMTSSATGAGRTAFWPSRPHRCPVAAGGYPFRRRCRPFDNWPRLIGIGCRVSAPRAVQNKAEAYGHRGPCNRESVRRNGF